MLQNLFPEDVRLEVGGIAKEAQAMSVADDATDLSRTRISWAEARRLALESMRRAEREREEAAEKEARRGIQYNDQKTEQW